MAGNLNSVNIGDRDILAVINSHLKDVVEKEGYTRWIDKALLDQHLSNCVR